MEVDNRPQLRVARRPYPIHIGRPATPAHTDERAPRSLDVSRPNFFRIHFHSQLSIGDVHWELREAL